MALIAGNINVLAIKSEGSIIVIELNRFPRLCIVAFSAFRLPVLFKLPGMIILMAGSTGLLQALEFLLSDSGNGFEMAGSATYG